MKLQIRSIVLFAFLFISSVSLYSQFTEIGVAAGVNLDGRKDGGVSWGDMNEDGCPDLLVNTNSNRDTRLYRSDCNTAGTPVFTDVTATHAAGLLNVVAERSAIWQTSTTMVT